MYKNISLLPYNTFGIDVKADWLAEIESTEQLLTILDDNQSVKKLILGAGSNVLFLSDFKGIILLNQIKGKEVISETDEDILLKINAGEDWHELVMWAVENNYGGIENLALIPGKVGTAPIQNIGAYGVEIKNVIEEVHTLELTTGLPKIFHKNDCDFGYRYSIFKKPENKGRYFITAIHLKLSKKNHQLYTHYGAIRQILNNKNILKPQLKDIAQTIVQIRRSKLPDPKKIGNAGSFFKNPFVNSDKLEELLNRYPNIPYYTTHKKNIYKIPAGWLIEQAGWKGKRFGQVGVHHKQALVLVNFGKAKGIDIQNLANNIIDDISQKFGITLHPEVNYIQ